MTQTFYIEELAKLVNIEYKVYSKLMNELFDYTYYSIIPDDDNRIQDAKNLRDKYDYREGVDRISVLEILVSLAKRMKDEYLSPLDLDIIFDDMICNLDLIDMTNHFYNKLKVIKILDKFVNREYNKKGIGNIFPIAKTKRDQRKVSIWGQMLEYINYKKW